MGMSGPGQTDINSIVGDPKSAGVGFLDADLINLDGSDSGQITLGTPPDIADWGGFAQATAASRPHYDGAINGLTVPNFDGSDDYLWKAGTLGVGDRTFQIVFEKPDTTLTRTLFAGARSSDDNEAFIIVLDGDGKVILQTSGGTAQSNSVAPDLTPVVITILAPLGGGVTFYINGSNETLLASTFNPSGTDDRLLIGARRFNSPFAFWKGEYGALKIWSWTLSAQEQLYWDNVAFAKWGVP